MTTDSMIVLSVLVTFGLLAVWLITRRRRVEVKAFARQLKSCDDVVTAIQEERR